MTAKEVMTYSPRIADMECKRFVDAELPVIDVLPLLLDTPQGVVGVTEDGKQLGVITAESLLAGLGRLIAARDDCSVVEVECTPADYSASIIARAVEDVDVHLVDLLSHPAEEGKMRVMLRVRCDDPTSVVHSLERYGYEVVSTGGRRLRDEQISRERLLALQTLLNV